MQERRPGANAAANRGEGAAPTAVFGPGGLSGFKRVRGLVTIRNDGRQWAIQRAELS